MLKFLFASFSMGALFFAFGSCKEGASNCLEDESLLCCAGDNIFCKCQDGSEGTKTCSEDGKSFGQCFTSDGACREIPETTSTTDPTSSSTGGAGGGGSGSKILLEPCADASECRSGQCENGYCTRPCESYMDCSEPPANGDCAEIGGEKLCVSYCNSINDCTVYGPDSKCSGVQAFDDPMFCFGACADWPTAKAVPDGCPCMEDSNCHLGLNAQQLICIFQVCSEGCAEMADCPNGKMCSGEPGHCE
jgi:hypothetical protein